MLRTSSVQVSYYTRIICWLLGRRSFCE